MPIYWSYNSVPELAALPKARRREIWRECRTLKSPGLWFWLVFFPCWCGVLYLIDFGIIPMWHQTYIWDGAIAGAWGGIMGAALTHFKIVRSLPEIRRRIGGLCLNCGYDIRATPSNAWSAAEILMIHSNFEMNHYPCFGSGILWFHRLIFFFAGL
jgi:hypothetical protein